MKKMRMCFPKEKTFADGFAEYILDCKARNLRDGTIHHYEESIKQIYKRIPPDTPISSMNKQTMTEFYIALRDDPNLNEVTMGTFARDLKTLIEAAVPFVIAILDEGFGCFQQAVYIPTFLSSFDHIGGELSDGSKC